MAADFSGYATKNGLKCSDGRIITPNAFKISDGKSVPLVWQHQHSDPANVLGHAILENREDGVYAQGFFNNTPAAATAKALVKHGDVTALSIYANQLVQKGAEVLHGVIREVSLVLSGANPGALIDTVAVHGDDEFHVADDVVVFYSELALEHSAASEEPDPEPVVHADPPSVDPTVAEVFDSLDEMQKQVVYAMISAALEQSATTGDDATNSTQHNSEEGEPVSRNVFDQTEDQNKKTEGATLSHADVKGIVADAMKIGSFKDAVEAYALKHGIEDIDVLFPEAKLLTDQPDFVKRRTEWVAKILGGARKSPFSRIKTVLADITQAEARAKGYIKGNLKQEEFFGVTKRTTTPTTVYKKQKLDRDDIVDITDFDVVTWLKGEMRLMLDEELARAVLIGDGRDVSDIDKIKDPAGASDGAGIRSILNDHEMYTTTLTVNIDDANSSPDEIVDAIVNGMRFYRGTGMPTFYTTLPVLTKLLLAKDTLGRRLYATQAELASALMVSDIVTVEPMEEVTDLLGVIVNLQDYVLGADRGGEVSMFDDFDIDYNQQKYLIETRLSGGLVKYKAALAIKKTAAANVLVAPNKPTFVPATGVVTIPTQTGVVYKNFDTSATLTAGAQSALASGASLNVLAVPASGYYFGSNAEDQWTFTRP